MSQRLLGAVDLAIDVATLGEYGLEPQTAEGPCRKRSGHRSDWEALARPSAARARRGNRCSPAARRHRASA